MSIPPHLGSPAVARPEDARALVARRYRRFAEREAHGVSPLYHQLALGVADHPDTLAFLASLPVEKQQPNLLFAAFRHVRGVPADSAGFLAELHRHLDAVAAVMARRSVQTNEPARCATLLPVLARLPQPLALIEVGASAGLCLLPDRYRYRFGGSLVGPAEGTGPEPPTFPCEIHGPVPVPDVLPEVVWRVGLDLNPVDLGDADEVAWLQTLVWPEHVERAQRLHAALAVAAQEPPRVLAGDLRVDLAPLISEAPAGATLVVMHSAVLGYLPAREHVERFAAEMSRLPGHWLSNEASSVLPHRRAGLGDPPVPGAFLLALDGEPVAFTGPHGQFLHWLGA